MRKFISASPLAGLTIVLSVCLIIFFIINSCKKMDQGKEERNDSATIDKFFQLKAGTDPIVAAIAASIKRQDMQRKFVPGLTKKAGFALWDKAKVMTKSPEDGQQLFIPFVLEDKKQTKAMLIVRLNGSDTLYHLLYASQAQQYGFDDNHKGWNAKDIFHAFILFDNEIFGHKEFKVTENRLLGTTDSSNIIAITSVTKPTQARLQTIWEITITTTYLVCHSCGNQQRGTSLKSTRSNCCNAEYFEVPVTYWYNDEEEDDWGWYPPTGYETGGGEPCPGCSWEDTNPCEVDEQGHAVSFCDEGWGPETGVEQGPYDPYKADSVRISNYIRDSLPCLYSFLKDSLPNINYLAQIAGGSVFDDSAYMHLTFDTSGVNTTASAPSGVTIPAHSQLSVFVEGSGVTHFMATIKLNPWHLKHSTKEYMVSTIIHEAMHAIFTLRWGQYLNWLQYHDTPYDSNYIKTRFPIYWYAIQNQTVPLNALQDHEIMAADYVSTHADLVKPFYTSAPRAVRDTALKAMGYCGLHETTAWKLLPSIGIDTCKYKGIQIAAEQAATGGIYPTGCSGYNYHYANDWFMKPSCN